MDVTTDTFAADVIEKSFDKPVVVDFWADWCGPCKQLTPVIEQAVGDTEGAVELAKVDVDANQDLAQEYGIQGIPAVKAFRNGQIVNEFTGAQPAPMVENFLDVLLQPTAFEAAVSKLRDSGERAELLEAIDAENWTGACEMLIDSIQFSTGDERDGHRELIVAIFEHLGQSHEISTEYRRKLATVLY